MFAIAHAIARAKGDTTIVSDCRSAVQCINNHIQNGTTDQGDNAAAEIVNFILLVARQAPADTFRLRWMPSHLNDNGNQHKRSQYLADGTVDEDDIRMNADADRAANNGAIRHGISRTEILRADDRLALTTAIAGHLIRSWDSWIDFNRERSNGQVEQEEGLYAGATL